MAPKPLIDVRCAVCGEGAYEIIRTRGQVQTEVQYLRKFHQRRLRPAKAESCSALLDRVEFTQDYATAIVSCHGCGLIYRNPRPPADAIKRAYERDHYGRDRLGKVFEAQRELYRPKARYLGRWLPTREEQRGTGTAPSPTCTRVVEVGSFVGGFLAAGRQYGWDMLGVDPGKEVDSFCREHELRVFQGTLAEAPIEPGSIDCVAIWNTFDQLPNPAPTLEAAGRVLRPGGVLALRVPNGDCFRFAESWMPRLPRPLRRWLRATVAWNNLLAFPYLHGYSVRTLDWLLFRYGFIRVSIQPDTLVRLSDDYTKTWAVWEERLLKSVCRVAFRLERWSSRSGVILAPWFDAYYRRIDGTLDRE